MDKKEEKKKETLGRLQSLIYPRGSRPGEHRQAKAFSCPSEAHQAVENHRRNWSQISQGNRR